MVTLIVVDELVQSSDSPIVGGKSCICYRNLGQIRVSSSLVSSPGCCFKSRASEFEEVGVQRQCLLFKVVELLALVPNRSRELGQYC